MTFKLSTDEENYSSTSKSDTSSQNYSYANNSTWSNDSYDFEEDSPITITNQNPTQNPTPQNISGVSYISQSESFPPILMFAGIILSTITLILFITYANNGSLIPTNPDDVSITISNLTSIYILSIISQLCNIIDAIIIYKKKMSGFSIIIWAVIFPIVYIFKRCKANRNSNLIAIGVTIAMLALSFISANCVTRSMFKTMNIDVDESGIAGSVYALSKLEELPDYSYTFDNSSYYKYSDIIIYNINNPTFSYIKETSTSPALLVARGTTTLRGQEENIAICFNYNKMNFHSITIGSATYNGDEFGLLLRLVDFAKTTPPSSSTQHRYFYTYIE